MKVRVLYPTAFGPHLKGEEPEGGSIVNIDQQVAEALISEGFAEPVDAKPPVVEQATAAPGEKRKVGRPRKNP